MATELRATKWGPRPASGWSSARRNAYFAGYSDGFYGYERYTAYATPEEAPATYNLGFDDALTDGAVAGAEA